MLAPDELRYTAEHQWVRRNGNAVRVGITDYAQDAYGELVYVGLPDIGSDVVASGTIGELESSKSVSDIYAPVAGRVVTVNASLASNPQLLNSEPYDAGWLFDIEMTEPAEFDGLLDAAAYRALTEDHHE